MQKKQDIVVMFANQDDLIAERDKYGANDMRPGLSGWAQIWESGKAVFQ